MLAHHSWYFYLEGIRAPTHSTPTHIIDLLCSCQTKTGLQQLLLNNK